MDSVIANAKPRAPQYRGYADLIRVLTTEAAKRVRETGRVNEPKLEAITPQMRKLQRAIIASRKRTKALERKLASDHKARVDDYGKHELMLTYEERNRLKNMPEKSLVERLKKVAALRVKATLDTIDMSPTRAKAYLIKLEQTLARL